MPTERDCDPTTTTARDSLSLGGHEEMMMMWKWNDDLSKPFPATRRCLQNSAPSFVMVGGILLCAWADHPEGQQATWASHRYLSASVLAWSSANMMEFVADEALMGDQDLKEGSLTSMRMAYLLFGTSIARRHDDRKRGLKGGGCSFLLYILRTRRIDCARY